MSERSVNKAILVGRLGADAETRFTQNGTPVSRVSLAMNRQWTDSDKQVHEETDWMSIVIWNKENLATYLTKGTKLSRAHDNWFYVQQRFMQKEQRDSIKPRAFQPHELRIIRAPPCRCPVPCGFERIT